MNILLKFGVSRSFRTRLVHLEIRTNTTSVFYRLGIELGAGAFSIIKNNRFSESTANAIHNETLKGVENDIINFFTEIKNRYQVEPTESEIIAFLHGFSSLTTKQRDISPEEFVSWSYDHQKNYYKMNVEGKKVFNWKKSIQECVNRNCEILTNKDLYIFALRYKLEDLEDKVFK